MRYAIIRKPVILLLISLLSFSLFSQTVRVVNVQYYFDKSLNEVIIFYDLSESADYETYEITLSFLDGNNLIIKPHSVRGDIGKDVTGGEKKRIHWEIFNDIDELSETSRPIIIITTINNIPVDPSLTYIMNQINISNESRYNFQIKRDGLMLLGVGVGISALVFKFKADDYIDQQNQATNIDVYKNAGENAHQYYTASRITAATSIICVGCALYQYIWPDRSGRKKQSLNVTPLIQNGFNLALTSNF